MGNISNKKLSGPSQRQLRVSELIKRILADLILRMDFYVIKIFITFGHSPVL